MKRILKLIGWLAGLLIAVAAMLYSGLIAINWNDRPLSDSALRLEKIYAARQKLADSDNAFVGMLGSAAPPTKNAWDVGIKRIVWMKRSIAAGYFDVKLDPLPTPYDFKARRSSEFQEWMHECAGESTSCVESLRNGDRRFKEWVESERWLLERYKSIMSAAGWYEPFVASQETPVPLYTPLLEGQRLLFLEARGLLEAKKYVEARDLLEADIRYWRRMLSASSVVLSKMIAAAGVRQHFKLGGALLGNVSSVNVAKLVPAEWQVELSEAERSMMLCAAGEWKVSSRVVFDLAETYRMHGLFDRLDEETLAGHLADFFWAPLLKPQDAANEMAERFEQSGRYLSVPVGEYADSVNDLGAHVAERRANNAGVLQTYNFTGYVLASIEQDLSPYGKRVADLEGVRRLAMAAVEMHEHSVDRDRVEANLNSGSWRNPYTGQPFGWDPANNTLVFQGLDEGERGLHRILY